jgi:hypothetical protein
VTGMNDAREPRGSGLPGDRLQVGKPRLTFTHTRESGRPEKQIWLEDRIDREWVASYSLVPQAGRPIVAETRLVPYEPDAQPGSWSRSVAGAPTGGVPWRSLRALHAQRALEHAQRVMEWWLEPESPDDPRRIRRILTDFDLYPVPDRIKARRRRRSDVDVARAAAAYAAAPTGSKRQAVADEMCCAASTADKWIADARQRGMLPEARRAIST